MTEECQEAAPRFDPPHSSCQETHTPAHNTPWSAFHAPVTILRLALTLHCPPSASTLLELSD
jgi:hypothetical protein